VRRGRKGQRSSQKISTESSDSPKNRLSSRTLMRQGGQLLERVVVDSGMQKLGRIFAGVEDSEEKVIDAEDGWVGKRDVGRGGEGAVGGIARSAPCRRVDYVVAVLLRERRRVS
jgi:hypothetical protein